MVARAADRQGYVGEVWGTLQGDKIRAMHGLCRGLSYALNKGVAMQLVQAQETALRHYVSQPRQVVPGRYTTSFATPLRIELPVQRPACVMLAGCFLCFSSCHK